MSALFAPVCAWIFWVSKRQAAVAVRQHGYNVDSSALQYVVAIVFLMPVAVLFGTAAIAGAREWCLDRYVHWIAVFAAVGPIAYEVLVTASK